MVAEDPTPRPGPTLTATAATTTTTATLVCRSGEERQRRAGSAGDDSKELEGEAAADPSANDAKDSDGEAGVVRPVAAETSEVRVDNVRTDADEALLLITLRRCQRDADLLMARARHQAEAAREGPPPRQMDDPRPPDGGKDHESESALRRDLWDDGQRHYVVIAAASPPLFDENGSTALSSLKDSCVEEGRGSGWGWGWGSGWEEPSRGSASGPRPRWGQRGARVKRGGSGKGSASGSSNINEASLEEGARDTAVDASSIVNRGGTDRGGRKDFDMEGSDRDDDKEDEEEEDDGCTLSGAPDSDYPVYRVKVNPDQMDRAVDIPLYSAARPHMRAFHVSWVAFFVAFFVWFSIAPLLGEVAETLQLTHEQVWTSSCLAVASSAVTRVVVGPLNDMYGARYVMATTLALAAIPTGLAGAVVGGPASLYAVRFFIGVAGSAFVTCQYWTSSMFTAEIAGTANALAAGWGNLGGGVAQVVVGSILFPLFKLMYGGSGYTYHTEGEASSFETTGEYNVSQASDPGSSSNATAPSASLGDSASASNEARASELAWRTVLVIPAVAAIVMAWVVVRYSDDTPKGCVRKRRRAQQPQPQLHPPQSQSESRPSWSDNLWRGMRSRNTWVLFVQYACCFGCELALFNAAALYFREAFGQSTETAAAIASVFGWTNLFARGVGGFCSDMANAKCGMRGRLWVQSCFLVVQGVLIMAFSEARTLAGSIVTMVLFSLFLQASEGSTFAIVPYVVPEHMGSVAGLVGAGGNVGGVCFTLLFRSFDYQTSFLYMGAAVSASALFTVLVSIPGHRGLFRGQDSPTVYEHRRRAKLPQAVAFVRPDSERDLTEPAAEAAPEGAGTAADDRDSSASLSSSASASAVP